MLWGRRQQFMAVDGLLADVRVGLSRVLVVRGEPGIGKTALLGYAAETAQDFQVARAEGVESEMELAFAALHQLYGRMLGRLDQLPGPQREAVRDRIIAESGGNPLALLELPHGVTAEWAGGFGVAGPAPLAGRIEQSFQRRIAPLPEATQCLLPLDPAEPTRGPMMLWRTARPP